MLALRPSTTIPPHRWIALQLHSLPTLAHCTSLLVDYGLTYLRALALCLRRNIILSPTEIAQEEPHTWGHVYKVKSLFSLASSVLVVRKWLYPFLLQPASTLVRLALVTTLVLLGILLGKVLPRCYQWLVRIAPRTVHNTLPLPPTTPTTYPQQTDAWRQSVAAIERGRTIALTADPDTCTLFFATYTHHHTRRCYTLCPDVALYTMDEKIACFEKVVAELEATHDTALLILPLTLLLPSAHSTTADAMRCIDWLKTHLDFHSLRQYPPVVLQGSVQEWRDLSACDPSNALVQRCCSLSLQPLVRTYHTVQTSRVTQLRVQHAHLLDTLQRTILWQQADGNATVTRDLQQCHTNLQMLQNGMCKTQLATIKKTFTTLCATYEHRCSFGDKK